ncbi:FAD-dependent oxidoreductase [Desulfobotulus sp. H1]|uniref:FAD-dependent oxidoreductase n=1 Tax=Desulfobotulus pelophilus TaxID=2823377 RepID=A0ABT3N7Y3_9BACT|nr:FAD-dependent oxidoreductase [Desulfobotulus pelophilus]MCW7753560.1 FAD-dependent oxidoreductase [Desulfobotulus pelophilus]
MFAPAPSYQTDVIIIGGGIAGLVTALKLLDSGLSLLILDRDREEKMGGLAKESFGGICAVDTPLQKRMGIPDTPEIAWEDWKRVARFRREEKWSRAWAKRYVEHSERDIYSFLTELGIRFLPVVNWPERGMLHTANSLPRWHIAWGTGYRIIECLIKALDTHPHRRNLRFRFGHRVENLLMHDGQIAGCTGHMETTSRPFEAHADRIVLAAGGLCGGNLSRVRQHWPSHLHTIPSRLLNGSHRFADGRIHDAATAVGARLDHPDRQWHYAAGIPYPKSLVENQGLSLVPPRSALWLNAKGERIGPLPLMGYTDTAYLVERLCREEEPFSWLLLNRKIALRELAVSGCDYMTAFRYRKFFRMIRELLFGNRELTDRLIRESDEIITAPTLTELGRKMQQKVPEVPIHMKAMENSVRAYDRQIEWGPSFFTDDQLRRIAITRKYRGDRMRTCRFQQILDPAAGPLMAIRTFILTRKSLGGIRTDLNSRVLDMHDKPIPGLFAAGETAGFGGGNMHGRGALEGTFLGGAILTAHHAAQSIAKGE